MFSQPKFETIDTSNLQPFFTGAEAEIFKTENSIIKKRVSKKYRLDEIDKSIRKSRTKKEAKLICKMYDLDIKVPKLIRYDNTSIEMELIKGSTVKEYINIMCQNISNDSLIRDILLKCGKLIKMLHNNDIIHGDLTTLNLLCNENDIYVIDFGLSFISKKVEDKAVDLFTFEKSIKCIHNEKFIKNVLEGYGEMDKEMTNKIDEIRKRGRKRD